MENRIIKITNIIFLVSMLTVSCNQPISNKTEINKNKSDTTENNCFEDFKKRHNYTSDTIADYFAKYDDGRKSEIRTMLSYETLNCSLKQNPYDSTQINLIVIEWNINKGIAVCDNSSFANQDNNQMIGGDVESNRLLIPSAKKFMQKGKLFFEVNFTNLTKIETIPNRNLDYVSFDFITNKGIFTIQENIEKLKSEKTSLGLLFKEAEKLKLEIENISNR